MSAEIKAISLELITIRDLIRYAISKFNATDIFYGHGTADSREEALAIILAILHLPLDVNAEILDARLLQAEREAILAIIQRRITERVPAAYLINQAYFAGLEFFVDARVLVPRSPIAELIEQQFQPWLEADKVTNILDLCTGSACIGIACGYAFPAAKIVAADISADALDVAAINVEKHQLQSQVELVKSDLFAAIEPQKFNLIVSNPPYVAEHEMATIPPEYHHEPRLGLISGEDGLDLVRQILQQAAAYLADDGILVVEVGNSQYALQAALPDLAFTWLEFERGGEGVFLLTADQVKQIYL